VERIGSAEQKLRVLAKDAFPTLSQTACSAPSHRCSIFSSEKHLQANPGTGIANAVCHLATEVTDRFRLDPRNTIYIEHTPPEERWPFFIDPDEEGLFSLGRRLSSLFGPGEEKYEQIFFQRWSESSDYVRRAALPGT